MQMIDIKKLLEKIKMELIKELKIFLNKENIEEYNKILANGQDSYILQLYTEIEQEE